MKYLDAEVKAIDDNGPGEFTAIASTPSLDRDRERILKGAFLPLPPSLPIHVDHKMSSEGIVGSGRPYYEDDRLMVHGRFASTSKAQAIRTLVTEGHMGFVSVGFMDTKRDDKDRNLIVSAELLEISLVTVPSNRDARVLAAKRHSGSAVTEARRAAIRSMVELALFDAKQALSVDTRETVRKAERLLDSPQMVLADAQRLLRELGR